LKRATRSLLEELESLGQNRDTKHIIESRAHNIITSAINLLELINKHYPEEQAQILERKLLSAIKSKDQQRFSKSLRKNREPS
jgi:MFS superfamily sulfate permease-like transporter